MSENPDEALVRHVIAECLAATSAGDLARVQPHLAEDLVYFISGEPPMRGRAAFLAGLEALLAGAKITAEAEVQEVKIMGGDHAYCLNLLTVTFSPHSGDSSRRRTGYTLTLLRRDPATHRWLVFRNCNMLTEL